MKQLHAPSEQLKLQRSAVTSGQGSFRGHVLGGSPDLLGETRPLSLWKPTQILTTNTFLYFSLWRNQRGKQAGESGESGALGPDSPQVCPTSTQQPGGDGGEGGCGSSRIEIKQSAKFQLKLTCVTSSSFNIPLL